MVGDANGDGIANALDLQILQKNLGKPGGKAQGDFDGNGIVNSNDLTILNDNFQRRLPDAYFGKILDTSTPIPSGVGNFTLLDVPTVDSSGNLAFKGTGPANWGVYKWSAGVVSKLADNTTNIPNGTGQFVNFGRPSISSGKVLFQGVGNAQEGIYSSNNGVLTTVVNKTTARPEGGTFSTLGDPSLVNAAVAFIGTGTTDSNMTAYTLTGSTVTPVVSTATPIPGGSGNFVSLGNAVSDGTSTWFAGGGIGQMGIYKKTGGVVTTLLNRDTVIPGTSYHITSAGNLSLDGQNLSFNGRFGGVQGVFDLIGSTINRIADTRTAIPGGHGQFSSFGVSSLGGSSVAFVGYDAQSNPGIYASINGELERVIDTSVMLNGKTITQLDMSRDAVVGNKIVFQAIFGDGSGGIYSASLLNTRVPGDINNDGVVDHTDLAILQGGLGKPGTRSQGDLNGDGLINMSDFQILERNFGRTGTPALLGDTDGDGKVDNNDLKVFFANNGKYGSMAEGDFNGDGKVDFKDYQYLEVNFGKTAAAFNPFSSASAAGLPDGTVPEPTGAIVAVAGLLVAAGRRRR
jgi:hypothetical protein